MDFRLLTYSIPPSEFSYARLLGSAPSVEDLGKAPPYTLQAIPVFFALFVIEFLVGMVQGKKLYRLNDFVTSVCSGSVMLIVNSFLKYLQLSCYCYIWENWRVVNLEPDSWTVWIGLFLSIDCGYYWMHRCAHTFHWMWSAHSVHHSGEDYNLATALRQGALQGSYSWMFYLPCALFFHPGAYVGHAALNTLGQFWIHTKIIGSCGPLEYILNTPSHHRMHHRPPGNCNYAAVLIIWDRMFGTFVREGEQQEYYGLAKSHDSFDTVFANMEHFKRMIADGNIARFFFSRRTQHKWFFDPLVIFTTLPASSAESSLWTVPSEPKREKHDPSLCISTNIYVMIQFVLLLGTALLFLLKTSTFTLLGRLAWAGLLLLSFSHLGRIVDGKGDPFFIVFEAFRLIIFSSAIMSLA